MADLNLRQGVSMPEATVTKYRDMGDGTHALVIAIGPIPAGAAKIGIVGVEDRAGNPLTMDDATFALNGIDHGHHEVHAGDAYEVDVIDMDFDKADEINICFRTPDTAKWLHMFPLVAATTEATFDILEGPTVTNGTGTDYQPRNRNRNSSKMSAVSSIKAVPIIHQVSLNATITADGFVVHTEVLGTSKGQGGSTGGTRDTSEIVLRQNTVYAFRIKGNNTGSDNTIAGISLSWYEHTNK